MPNGFRIAGRLSLEVIRFNMNFLKSSLVLIAIVLQPLDMLGQEDDFSAFVETISGDTIQAQSIRDHHHFWQKERRYVLKFPNGAKKKLLASDISSYGKLENRRPVIYKIVEVQRPSGSRYLREMEIIDRGKITLLREWHEANSWFYVESPFFTGYLESEFEINNMLTYLRSCKTFKLEFDEGSKLNYKNLPDLILFFNKNCPD